MVVVVRFKACPPLGMHPNGFLVLCVISHCSCMDLCLQYLDANDSAPINLVSGKMCVKNATFHLKSELKSELRSEPKSEK